MQQKTIERVTRFAELGADQVLVITPYYNKTSDAGLLAHFTAIADQSPVPIILYNVPSRTGMTIPHPSFRKVSKTSKNHWNQRSVWRYFICNGCRPIIERNLCTL